MPRYCKVLELDDSAQVCNSWSFDYVWGANVSTSQVFDDLASPVVDKAMDGVNGTIFAYGQTAAGKTYSMFGNELNPGITTRAVHAVFEKVKEAKFSEYLIRASYVELYNEDIRDLLASPEKPSKGDSSRNASPGPGRAESEDFDFAGAPVDLRLKIAEDPKTGPYVKGAVERVVERPEQIMDLIKFGEKNRSYGSTAMNERSSRSHVIVRLVIKRGFVSQASKPPPGVDPGGLAGVWHSNPKIPQRVSALNFVDLAGSEKSKKTGATGAQLKEANAINKSLLTLGSVINRLSDGAPGNGHVPYRDSKLTHLLSASLGGNASTAMLACVSATDYNREETQSTLR